MRERDTTVSAYQDFYWKLLVSRSGKLAQGVQPCVKTQRTRSPSNMIWGSLVEMDYDPGSFTSGLAILKRHRHRNTFHRSFDQDPVLDPPVVPTSRVEYPVVHGPADTDSPPRKPRTSILPLVNQVSVVADQPVPCTSRLWLRYIAESLPSLNALLSDFASDRTMSIYAGNGPVTSEISR